MNYRPASTADPVVKKGTISEVKKYSTPPKFQSGVVRGIIPDFKQSPVIVPLDANPQVKKIKQKTKCIACGKEIGPDDHRCTIKMPPQKIILCEDCGYKVIDGLLHRKVKENGV